MYGPQPHHSHRNLRFYIVMITIVIGGIMFLLFMNNNPNDLGLTSLAVGEIGQESVNSKTDTTRKSTTSNRDTIEEAFSKEIAKTAKEVEVLLKFDRIPEVKKEARITEMDLTFDDLTTKIQVNSDKLELSNLKEVNLKIKGFIGKVDFDSQGISLSGTAKSIAVNDVTLSSRGEIKISFENLDYDSLLIDEIELPDLELSNGDGSLEVPQKLTYSLEQDKLKIFNFNGKLEIERDVETSLEMEGVVRGMIVNGALLDFNLR